MRHVFWEEAEHETAKNLEMENMEIIERGLMNLLGREVMIDEIIAERERQYDLQQYEMLNYV